MRMGAVEYLLWAAAGGQLPSSHVALHVLDGLSAALIDIRASSHWIPIAVHFHPAASHVASGSRWDPHEMFHAFRRGSLEIEIDTRACSRGLNYRTGFGGPIYQYTDLVYSRRQALVGIFPVSISCCGKVAPLLAFEADLRALGRFTIGSADRATHDARLGKRGANGGNRR